MKKKCLDEGLAQRLASSNVELTNFCEKRALSEFGEEGIERDFCNVVLAIKSLRNEWNEGSIYRFWLGISGGLEFGLEPKLRLGDQIRREIYNQVAHM